uniref:cytochrome c oxidase subunit III n=1 Tax=Laqueus japonicus TaxID=147651 RepID=UPI000EF35731|nr:cytochrome c oxidase subunit III [Laqueus japonicus]AYI69528.1 cytochrome c oxidase subunit III [Laqueus japonicus]
MVRTPFHLVEVSPWPLMGAVGGLALTVGLAVWMHGGSMGVMGMAGVLIVGTMLFWWRDVVREGTYQGFHTSFVVRGLRFGMILFIVSEVCFFFAFFWAYFHSALSPVYELGSVWPPVGIKTLNPLGVPLLNTLVLLASGATVTWAHHSIIGGSHSDGFWWLLFTVVLGVYFTKLQLQEYSVTSFSVSDSVFGSVFFVATGFHGAHVMIGSIFLGVTLFRHWEYHLSSSHHFGFEAAAWYWHFVDVVWIFLYINIYCWGS